jgi:hypothetical protein
MNSENEKQEAQPAPENRSEKKPVDIKITLSPPRFGMATFHAIGTVKLVIHRFSPETLASLDEKKANKKTAAKSGKSEDEPKKISRDVQYKRARYVSTEGWDGMSTRAWRAAMISLCRITGYAMTHARLCVFALPDGHTAPPESEDLVHIHGKPEMHVCMARVSNGNPYNCVRAAYWPWEAKVRLRWDLDQFSLEDITNLFARVGAQGGVGEGRPDSKKSAGMGWGLFDLGGVTDVVIPKDPKGLKP